MKQYISYCIYCLSLYIFFPFYSQAQSLEKTYWYFGNSFNDLYFTTNGVNLLANQALPYGIEGSGVCTHPSTGELLFYTDGDRIYDSSHQPMPNAMFGGNTLINGNPSCNQVAAICAVPGQCEQYYVFTNTASLEGETGHVYYHIVDMNQAGNGSTAAPKGDIVQKNQWLYEPTSEGMLLIKAEQDDLYWLILHEQFSNKYHVYRISNVGIAPFNNYNLGNSMYAANICYNEIAKKIAVSPQQSGQGNLLIMDFNPTNGLLSNPFNVPNTTFSDLNYQSVYDTEWSPDGTKLYYSRHGGNNSDVGGVYQYNLAANSTTLVSPITKRSLGLKLTPLGYIAHLYSNNANGVPTYMGRINNPNAAVPIYQTQQPFGTTNFIGYQFPEFLVFDNIPPDAVPDTYPSPCLIPGQNIALDVRANDTNPEPQPETIIPTFAEAQWGTASWVGGLLSYTAPLQNGCHTTDTLRYAICDQDLCFPLCDTAKVAVCLVPQPISVSAGSDISVCNGVPVTLQASGGTSYQWSPPIGLSNTNTANPNAAPTQTTTYTVTITDAQGCSATDAVTVSIQTAAVQANPDNVPAANCLLVGQTTILSIGNNDTGFSQTTVSLLLPPTLLGTAILLPDKSVQYTAPTQNDCAISDIFQYEICHTACPDVCSTAQVTVCLAPQGLPAAYAGNDIEICSGSSTQLQASGGTTYQWSPSIGLNSSGIANPIAYPSQTTTYTVTITDAQGCSGTDSVVVSVANDPPLALDDSPADCLPAAGSLLIPILNNDSNTENTFIQILQQGIGNAVLTANAIQYTAPSVNLCTLTDTFTYRLCKLNCLELCDTARAIICLSPSGFAVSISGNTTICAGESTVLEASGGTNYQWSPNIGLNNTAIASPIASPSQTTTYTVTATNAQGCSNTAQTTITVVSPNINAQNYIIPDCIPTVGAQNIDVLNNISPTDYTVEIVSIQQGSAVMTSDYSIFYEQSAGVSCIYTDTITYRICAAACPSVCDTAYIALCLDNQPFEASAMDDTIVCAGTTIELAAFGGDSYQWSPSTDLQNPNTQFPTLTATTSQTYYVTISNTQNCAAVDSVTISIYDHIPDAQPDNYTTIDLCLEAGTSNIYNVLDNDSYYAGASIQIELLSVQLGTASISGNSIVYTASANNLCIPYDTLVYRLCDLNCPLLCDTTNMVICLQTIGVAVNVPEVAPICLGESVVLSATATGGTSYLWQPTNGLDNPQSSTPTATPTETTMYTVTAYDQTGCAGTGAVEVIVWNEYPIATPDIVTTCLDSDSSIDIDITINDFNTDETILLTILDTQHGIAELGDENIILYHAPTLVGCLTTDTIRYQICDPICTMLCDTTYVAICLNSEDIPVGAGNPQTICLGDSAVLQAVGGVNYQWSPTQGLSADNIASPTATPTQTTIYTVTVTNDNNCTNTASVVITVQQPIINLQNDAANGCLTDGESHFIPVLENDNISTGDLTITEAIATQGEATALPNGSILYTAPMHIGCQNADTVQYIACSVLCPNVCDTAWINICLLPSTFAPTITANTTTICLNDSTQLFSDSGATFAWSPSNGLSADNVANPWASPTTTTTYTATITDAGGCSATTSITIIVEKTLPIAQPDTPANCLSQGESLNFPLLENDTQLAEQSVVTLLTPPIWGTALLNATTGEINYIANSGNGCQTLDSLQYEVCSSLCSSLCDTTWAYICLESEGLDVTISSDMIICLGDSVPLQASGGVSYQWSPTEAITNLTTDSPTVFPQQSTVYSVTVTDASGCIGTAQTTVQVENIALDAGSDSEILAGSSTPLMATTNGNIVTYSWQPADILNAPNTPNPIAMPLQTTVFEVVGTSDNGCLYTDSVQITVLPLPPDCSAIAIPTAFSPNGDSYNDYFRIATQQPLEAMTLQIYNRWGETVFVADNVYQTWDGTHNGKPQPIGVYVFYLTAICQGETVLKKGNITLIR